jgi:ComF family protein
MKINLELIKNYFLDVFFPKFCLNCGAEGNYLCEDCFALMDVLESSYCLCEKPFRLPFAGKCQKCQQKKLNGLYFALSYQNNLVKKLISQFKYEPFVKELSKELALLIITHFSLLNKTPEFSDSIKIASPFNETNFILVPIPLYKQRLKWRGFNQAEELAKELSKFLLIPVYSNILVRIKETLPQVNLAKEERENNVRGAFAVRNSELKSIEKKKVLLVDDVYTTGSTMEECARVLKESGAKEVWGIAVARD